MWRAIRLLAAVAIVGILCWRLGVGAVFDGVAAIDGWTIAAAILLAALTTLCSAWRWCLVARGLGIRMPLGTAVAAYYRSQFLNTTLPGGVLGDVHRGVTSGRATGDVGLGVRTVGWERMAGQIVQLSLAGILLAMLPSPVRSWMPLVLGAVVVTALAVAVAATTLRHHRRARTPRPASRWAERTVRVVVEDIRRGLLRSASWPGIVLASTAVLVGHTATFLLAARTAGAGVPTDRLLPLALIVLVATSLPINIGGWGPREGVAAWAFAAAGLGAAQGLSAAVVYGILVFVAVLPGGLVLLGSCVRPGRRAGRQSASIPVRSAVRQETGRDETMKHG